MDMKALVIGNSFARDALRYLHSLAKKNNEDIKCVNLYFGGCCLKTHYLNCLDDRRAYEFDFNGEATGIFVTAREALESDDWDVVVMHQACRFSHDFDTFIPYIEKLKEYIGIYSPKSKIYINQTWCYESGNEQLAAQGYQSPREMLKDVKAAYSRAAELIGADKIIPSGEAMLALASETKAHRDKFHASLGAGRYLLARVWFKALTGKNATAELEEFDEPISAAEMKLIQQICSR